MLEVKTKHSPDNSDFVLKLKKLIQVHRKLTILNYHNLRSFIRNSHVSTYAFCMHVFQHR